MTEASVRLKISCLDTGLTSATNYAAPSSITTGSLTENMSWSTFLGPTYAQGPNGDTMSVAYDSFGRTQYTTSPFGAGTRVTYGYNPPTVTTTVVPGGATPTHWTKNTLNGLGRAIKTESGTGSTTLSVVDTEYDSCGCSPFGKTKRVSMPHAPGAGAVWTTNTYDGLGRTVSVLSADGASTKTYSYWANTVTATDEAGKWKKFTQDAFGNLTHVDEPNPAGGTFTTTYAYDVLNHLTNVSMPRPTGTRRAPSTMGIRRGRGC